MKRFAAAIVALIVASAPARGAVKADETVVFYPAIAVRVGDDWQFELRTRIVAARRFIVPQMLAPLRQVLHLEHLNDAEEAIFHDRARLFLTDSETGKALNVQLGQRIIALQRSGVGGFSLTRLSVADTDAQRIPLAGYPTGWVGVRAVLDQQDRRGFGGPVQLIDPQGVSIISDIDDTIKLTNVLDRREMTRNTFARPFIAVPGMAEVYARWLKTTPGGAVHYVSAGPWQLYEPLEAFRQASGFPPGSYHLRALRVSELAQFGKPETTRAHKIAAIEALLKRYPDRTFWLVGDSGEQDPEIYGDIARRFGKQVARIFIRDITNGPIDMERFRRAFDDLPSDLHAVFRVASELPETFMAPAAETTNTSNKK